MADPKVNLAFKLEANRVESADYVLWALETHGETLVNRLESPADPTVKTALAESGLVPPQVMIDWYHEQVSRVRAELVKKARVYRSARSERSSCWQRLFDSARTVGSAMSGIRDQFFSTYGEEFSMRLGFARQTPQRYVELQEYLGYVLERLSQTLGSMPDPAPGRLPIDVPGQIALLEPLHASVKGARECYHVARREAQLALLVRDEAVESYDGEFPWLAGGFENLLRIANMKPLAAAVRPSTRRKGLIAVVAGEAPDPGDPTGEDPASDEEPSSPAEEPATEPASDEPSDDEFAEIDSGLQVG